MTAASYPEVRCASCGQPLTATARFCESCGAPGPTASDQERTAWRGQAVVAPPAERRNLRVSPGLAVVIGIALVVVAAIVVPAVLSWASKTVAPTQLDTAKAETDIAQSLARRTGSLVTVECEETEWQTGGYFDCTATDFTGRYYVRGHMDDDEGRYSWELSP